MFFPIPNTPLITSTILVDLLHLFKFVNFKICLVTKGVKRYHDVDKIFLAKRKILHNF